MKFERFGEAHEHAKEKRVEAREVLALEGIHEDPHHWLEREEVDYLIRLQVQAWGKDQPADYRKYAETLWSEILERSPVEDADAFKKFEARLLLSLHEMPIGEHVDEKVREHIPHLVKAYGRAAKKIVLWSTGDVSSTGFQIAKVERSRVVGDFYRALMLKLPKDKAREFMDEKTAYMVDDDKFDRFEAYVREVAEKGKEMKVVMIEDTSRNFEKTEQILRRINDEGYDVRLIPIWAGYSRYARRARKMAGKRGEIKEFEEESRRLNTVQHFEDLLHRDRFSKIFKDAHVFVDFDGVLVKDETRRQLQAETVYGALVESAKNVGMNEEDVLARMKEKVEGEGARREISDPRITEVLEGDRVAILTGSKDAGTEFLLYKKGIRAVVYVDAMNIGIARAPDEQLRMDHPNIRRVVEMVGEADQWFRHTEGALYCHGSRKAPASTPSRVNPRDIAAAADRLLKELD